MSKSAFDQGGYAVAPKVLGDADVEQLISEANEAAEKGR